MRRTILTCDDVSRTYPGTVPVRALRHASVSVSENDYVAITGPSGSGKSTLLNIMGLIDVPTSGRYILEERETTGVNDRIRTQLRASFFGFVFQAFHLLQGRSVRQNVELGMIYSGLARKERQARAESVLERVGLADRAGADPSTLSGGERQRVAIARALAHRPTVLLCDEPTGNLDSETSSAILDLISELHCNGLTVLVVTHDEAVSARALRHLHVSDGHVVEVPA